MISSSSPFLGRVYFWSTDSVYVKFIERNLKVSHRRHVRNF
jgi:hypothetical protein